MLVQLSMKVSLNRDLLFNVCFLLIDHGFSSKQKTAFGRGQRVTPGGGSSSRKGPSMGADWGNNDASDRRSPRGRAGSNSPTGGGWGGRHDSNPGTSIKDERERA